MCLWNILRFYATLTYMPVRSDCSKAAPITSAKCRGKSFMPKSSMDKRSYLDYDCSQTIQIAWGMFINDQISILAVSRVPGVKALWSVTAKMTCATGERNWCNTHLLNLTFCKHVVSQNRSVKSWDTIAASLPGRSNQDCRKRWNQVSLDLKKGAWTPDEDERLHQAVKDVRPRLVASFSQITPRLQEVPELPITDLSTRKIGTSHRKSTDS